MQMPRHVQKFCDYVTLRREVAGRSGVEIQQCNGQLLQCFNLRTMLRLRQPRNRHAFQRLFTRQLSLAYAVHEPAKVEAGRPPLIILHGLFGSKQNNRRISK